MTPTSSTLIEDIDAFLSVTAMGESYFGKRAAGNSELVSRLRKNGRVWPETEAKIRAFMNSYTLRSTPAPSQEDAA